MAEPIVLSDSTLEKTLYGDKPVLMLISSGEGLKGDFTAAFKKAVDDHPDIVIAKIDPAANPGVAQRFDVGSKPIMVGWYCGEEILRRNRPWGSDVPLAIDMLEAAVKERNPAPPAPEKVEETVDKQTVILEDKPVHVTDETFEQEVLNHDKPVLVDFWAEWCGPCRMVAPILEKLAKEFAGQIRIAKVDTDANPGLSQYFRIMSIPTIMCVKNRTIVFSQPGALPEAAFRDLIQQLIKLEVPARQAAAQAVQ